MHFQIHVKINLKSQEKTIVKLKILREFINILETCENRTHYKTARWISFW